MPDDTKTRLGKAAAQYAAVNALWQGGKTAHKWWEERYSYSISVDESDNIYPMLLEWLMKHTSDKNIKHLSASTLNVIDYSLDRSGTESKSGTRNNYKTIYSAADNIETSFTFEGIKIQALIAYPEGGNGGGHFAAEPGSISTISSLSKKQRTLTLTVKKHAELNTLYEVLESCRARLGALRTTTSVWVPDKWGSGWERNTSIKLRSINTVTLVNGQKERILQHLDEFLSNEQEHIDRGIPWHTGIMLHGTPGSGKSSLVKALADHYKLDLYYLPLGDIKKDSSIMESLSYLTARSILLLEDIDVFSAVHRETSDPDTLSLSGLLNALDGIATPHGLITVMTTNDLSNIDSAVIRPGRVDLCENLDVMDDDQATRLFNTFYSLEGYQKRELTGQSRSSADLYNVMKSNFHEPDLAFKTWMG